MVRMVFRVGAPSRFLSTSNYEIAGDTIHFLGLVHERRHPDFLKEQLSDDRFGAV